MSILSKRIAARFLTAMDQYLALAIMELVKTEINSKVPGIDWDWDVADAGITKKGLGWVGRKVSWPGKPYSFKQIGILGGILVKGELATEPIPGQSNVITLEIGYYHKHKGGDGEYSYATPLGTYDINISDKGVPTWAGSISSSSVQKPPLPKKSSFVNKTSAVELVEPDPDQAKVQNLDEIGKGIQELIEHIEKHPPSVSKSRHRDIIREQEKEDTQQKQVDVWEAEKDKYKSIDAFRKHIMDNNDGVFGRADVTLLTEGMYRSPSERINNRSNIMEQLKDQGLTFDPRKNTISASPDDIVIKLNEIADAINRTQNPSRQLVATAIRDLIQLF